MSRKITDLPVATEVAGDDPLLVTDTSAGLSKQADAELVRDVAGVVAARLFDDFLSGVTSLWDDTNSTGTGVVTFLEASDAESDEGFGIVKLDTGAAAGVARYEHGTAGTPFEAFRGSLTLVAELRVKAPASPKDVSFVYGFVGDTAGSILQVEWVEGVGTWTLTVQSTAGGGGPTTDATAVAAVAGWQTIRIELDPGAEARILVDGVLVATVTSATDVPQGVDSMSVSVEAETAGATAGAVLVDWFLAKVNRT